MSGLLLCTALSGCARGPKAQTQAPKPADLAKRVSSSFLRCVEVSGAACVENPPEMRAWDAVSLLAWIHEASPVSVLGALNGELVAHTDLEQIQKRFVKETQRARSPLQGAACKGVKAYAIKDVLGRLVPAVQTRLQSLGILDNSMQEVIEALANEGADGVGQGQLVQVECANEPNLTLYTVVTKVQGKLSVVGMSSTISPLLLGESGKARPSALAPKKAKLMAQGAESYVHPWIDLEWELY